MALRSLGEVAEIIAGQSPPSASYNSKHEGLPFFQGKVDFNEVYPSVRIWCTEPNKVAIPNDILISVRAPVGPTNICNVKSCIG
jgi:type I restriction enzyme S subunit